MALPSLSPNSMDLLKEWHRKAVVRRLSLPGDYCRRLVPLAVKLSSAIKELSNPFIWEFVKRVA